VAWAATRGGAGACGVTWGREITAVSNVARTNSLTRARTVVSVGGSRASDPYRLGWVSGEAGRLAVLGPRRPLEQHTAC